jgi:hypothetical protein
MMKTKPRVGRMVTAGAFALAVTVVGARTARCGYLDGDVGPLDDALTSPISATGAEAIVSATAPGTILAAEEGTDTGDEGGGGSGGGSGDDTGDDEGDDGGGDS